MGGTLVTGVQPFALPISLLGLVRAGLGLLEREHAQLAGAVLGQEGLVALDVEVAREILNAACALPAAMLRLDEFEPRFQPVIVEGGADRIVFLEFEMAIMRGRGAEADRKSVV